jgi:hypothetical protein
MCRPRNSFYGQFLSQTGHGNTFPTYVGKRQHGGSVFPVYIGRRQQRGGADKFPVYIGKRYKGFGIWSDIAGKVKDFFKPLLTKDTLKYVGKKGLKAALGIAKDTLVKDEKFLDSLKKRAGKIGKEVVHDIKEKVVGGSGRKNQMKCYKRALCKARNISKTIMMQQRGVNKSRRGRRRKTRIAGGAGRRKKRNTVKRAIKGGRRKRRIRRRKKKNVQHDIFSSN